MEVKAVRSWAAHVLDVPENFIEPLQLVRYTDGQHIGLLDDLRISWMIGRAIVYKLFLDIFRYHFDIYIYREREREIEVERERVDSFLSYARGRFPDSIW